MKMNESDKSLSRRQEKNLLKAANAIARNEFDNPEREGCPDSETLGLLARRRDSAESADLIDHIGTCSPCFNEYSQYRAAHKRGIRIMYALASAAAVVLLAVAVSQSWQRLRGRSAVPPTTVASSPIPGKDATPLVLDLRMKGVSRSDSPNGQPYDPSRLPRVKLSLSILLPIGSEDGIYDVAVIGSSGQPIRTATGNAKLQNFAEVLPVILNLSDLAPGAYELRIRLAETPWNAYPILLE